MAKKILRVAGFLLLVGFSAVVIMIFFRGMAPLPSSVQERKEIALEHLYGLRHQMRNQNAGPRMQQIFPEGGCFIATLYGLAWTNLAHNFDCIAEEYRLATSETNWILKLYGQDFVKRPFSDTQVRNGVFWLGQRNLLIAQLLRMQSPNVRSPDLENEFHSNSKELAEAFLKSPTGHLDSYPGLCWPADNVTALRSLTLHDQLYPTDYRKAYEHWKKWTMEHLPETGLPAGQIDSQLGSLLQPARGCANSWILTLLWEMDPEFASKLYQSYRTHFGLERLGFAMFREYPATFPGGQADIDSGPIIWEAGVTATVVSLATAISNQDFSRAEDCHNLVNGLGFKRNIKLENGKGVEYLFGKLPIADAFITWAYTLQPSQTAKNRSLFEKLSDRKSFSGIFVLVFVFCAYIGFVFLKKLGR